MTRRSYSGLMRQPVWYLISKDDELVGTVRAPSLAQAKRLFLTLPPEFRRGGKRILNAPSWDLLRQAHGKRGNH